MADSLARTALIVVDMQPDFMEGGALATQDGSSIVPGIRELMLSGRYKHISLEPDSAGGRDGG